MEEFEQENHLIYFDNYGPFKEFVQNPNQEFVLNTDGITEDTWDSYFNGVMNIFRDGIESDLIRQKKVRIVFGDSGKRCSLYLTDLYFNIIMWNLIIAAGDKIKSQHLIFAKHGSLPASRIKEFVDRFFVLPYRGKISNTRVNNVINDTLCSLFPINEFSAYLADTLNLEDSLELARKNPRYNELLHVDLSNTPLEDINNIGMQLTNEMVEIEKNAKQYLGYDHCLANAWRAETSANKKQYKEAALNIGAKPAGDGTVFPYAINHSFMNGGVSSIGDYLVDASAARTAQILSHSNVSSSGHFARLLGLNNSDTFLNLDKDDICHTVNLIHITLKTLKHIKMYADRFYRLDPRGVVKCLDREKDKNLLGKTIYVYSPMTCDSHSHGRGICHRCYGELYYTNYDVNIGKLAAELISSRLTQILLSAKHLLEALIKKVIWSEGFDDFFEMEYNSIRLKPDCEIKNVKMIIDPDSIDIENEDDYDEDSAAQAMKECIPSFKIVIGDKEFVIEDEDNRDLYISPELNDAIRKHATPTEDGMISIDLEELEDIPIFFIRLVNNELSRVLDRLMAILNKKPITETFDASGIVQEFIDTLVNGGLNIQAVHCETVLSDQIRNAKDMFAPIEWSYPGTVYKLVTLNDSLTNNKSVTISLMYQKLGKTLYNPLTFKKSSPSFIDLFFLEKPQKFLNSKFAKSKYDTEAPNKLPFDIQLDNNEDPKESKVKESADLPFSIIE